MLQESNEPPKGCIKVEWNGSFYHLWVKWWYHLPGAFWNPIISANISIHQNWAYILVWKGRVSHHEFHYKKNKGALRIHSWHFLEHSSLGNPHVPLWVWWAGQKKTNYHSVHKHANDKLYHKYSCLQKHEGVCPPCCTFSTFLFSGNKTKINNMFLANQCVDHL